MNKKQLRKQKGLKRKENKWTQKMKTMREESTVTT